MSSYTYAAFKLRTSKAASQQENISKVYPCDQQQVTDLVGRVSDKWTIIVLKVLTEVGEIPFCHLARRVGKISTKSLIHTLSKMECDGLIKCLIPKVKPPRVDYRMMDYKLTERGKSLGAAFCNVWLWAEDKLSDRENSSQQHEQS